MTTFNITYENMVYKTIYKQVQRDEAIEASDKKFFKCFQFQHLPNKNHRTGQTYIGVTTRVRMVEINKKTKEITYLKWNR